MVNHFELALVFPSMITEDLGMGPVVDVGAEIGTSDVSGIRVTLIGYTVVFRHGTTQK